MARIAQEICIALWQRAAHSEVGICVPSNNRNRLMNELYLARQEAKNPTLNEVIIHKSPNKDELWLVRNSLELEASDG